MSSFIVIKSMVLWLHIISEIVDEYSTQITQIVMK